MARVEVVAIVGVLALLATVVEAIRRKKLAEGFSLLWLLTALALLVLALWRELLDVLARWVGIFYPPAALFVVGFGFVLLILLQFSIIVSRLSRQNKELAQRLAMLEWIQGTAQSSRLGYAQTEQHDEECREWRDRVSNGPVPSSEAEWSSE